MRGGAEGGPQVVFRCICQGGMTQALAIAPKVDELRMCTKRRRRGRSEEGKSLQESLNHIVSLELTALGKSSLPELQKVQKRRRL